MSRTYLEDNPPVRSQFRRRRRAKPTGAIVVHTGENATDLTLPDGGAEAVARFISRRTDGPGSYHSIVDSDSRVRLGRFEWEMFHEGTGGNRWSLGLSFACRARQWEQLRAIGWADGAMEWGAVAAAEMIEWLKSEHGITVPLKRISPSEYRSGRPGFVGHGELDPGRRSDPGADFPWDWFLLSIRERLGGGDYSNQKPSREDLVRDLQRLLLSLGAQNLGHTGPERNGVDGDPGAGTIGDTMTLLKFHVDRGDRATGQVEELRERVASLEGQLENDGIGEMERKRLAAHEAAVIGIEQVLAESAEGRAHPDD